MPNISREIRYTTAGELEIRADDDKEPRIVGYAARFNVLSEDLGYFREKISRGAFRESIENDDVRALLNHDSNYVLGRSTVGTLSMREDTKGLKVDITPPDTQWARDLVVSIKRGDISQMSFGFTVTTEEWDESNKDAIVRTLKKVRLFDVSPVTYPAYPQTSVSVRGLSTYNIDVSVINRVALRCANGLNIPSEDRQAFDDVLARLQQLIPSLNTAQTESNELEDETPETRKTPQPSRPDDLWKLQLAKRKIELLNKECN